MTSSHAMSHISKRADNIEKDIASEAEGSLQPITDSLPPHEHDKSLKQELHEIDAAEIEEEVATALTRAPSRKDVLASKARLIALVLTLTGASFLNVSHVRKKRCYRHIPAPTLPSRPHLTIAPSVCDNPLTITRHSPSKLQ